MFCSKTGLYISSVSVPKQLVSDAHASLLALSKGSTTVYKDSASIDTPLPSIYSFENIEAISDDVQLILESQRRNERNSALGI